METMKKEIIFLDADNHRARLKAEITTRNGYPKFTLSGQYMGSHGQVIDHIKPEGNDQKELVRLWETYHLKDVSSMHNFKEHLEGVLARIEHAESERDTKKLEGDDAVLELMEQEDIDEDRLDAVKAYIAIMGDDDLKDFDEAYAGEYRDDEDFAREQAESMGMLDDSMRWPYTFIDWEQAARELMQDYSEQDGFYFRNV